MLAPWASSPGNSRGRVHPETPHPYRSDFQRDRDRVVHSRAFRRLEYKTQVFVTGICDHFRTRLTHTIEVAGVTRTVARCLGLNEDLSETIALAHDLGHPPFGHAGERELNELLSEHGGFDHNRQALKVVDELEEKYPSYQGLNLTWETRAGLVKHRDPKAPTVLDGRTLPPQPSLESQVTDMADSLTYISHDLDDGLSAGLIGREDVEALAVWQRAAERSTFHMDALDNERYLVLMIRNVIDMLVADLITASDARVDAAGLTGPEDVGGLDFRLVEFSDVVKQECRELRKFLFENVYFHPHVINDNERAVSGMRALYRHFLAHPDSLGGKARDRVGRVGLEIATADYIAGMTDRYAMELHGELVG